MPTIQFQHLPLGFNNQHSAQVPTPLLWQAACACGTHHLALMSTNGIQCPPFKSSAHQLPPMAIACVQTHHLSPAIFYKAYSGSGGSKNVWRLRHPKIGYNSSHSTPAPTTWFLQPPLASSAHHMASTASTCFQHPPLAFDAHHLPLEYTTWLWCPLLGSNAHHLSLALTRHLQCPLVASGSHHSTPAICISHILAAVAKIFAFWVAVVSGGVIAVLVFPASVSTIAVFLWSVITMTRLIININHQQQSCCFVLFFFCLDHCRWKRRFQLTGSTYM